MKIKLSEVMARTAPISRKDDIVPTGIPLGRNVIRSPSLPEFEAINARLRQVERELTEIVSEAINHLPKTHITNTIHALRHLQRAQEKWNAYREVRYE